MAQMVFRAATTAVATATTVGATAANWLDIPEWAPDIEYIPTGALGDNPDWAQFIEPVLADEPATSVLFKATGIMAHAARKVVLNNLAVAKHEKVTLCYREVGALVRA